MTQLFKLHKEKHIFRVSSWNLWYVIVCFLGISAAALPPLKKSTAVSFITFVRHIVGQY